jgi:hypothetical protein
MKIIELTSNLLLPITNEESELLDKFVQSEAINKTELTEREQVLAGSLVNKGVLERRKIDGKINYRKSRND